MLCNVSRITTPNSMYSALKSVQVYGQVSRPVPHKKSFYFPTVLFTSAILAFLIVTATALLSASSGTWSVLTEEVGLPVEVGPSVIGMISEAETDFFD